MGNKFGDYLFQLRKDRNLTLRDVEKQVKISNAYLSQVERGERGIPTMRILSKLAEVYGVSVSTLTEKAEEALKDVEKMAYKAGIELMSKGNKAIPEPDVEFICRGYENLSEGKKKSLKDFLQYLQNEDKRKK